MEVPQFWQTGGPLPCPPVVAAGDDVAYVIFAIFILASLDERRLEVGAEATDARAASPGSDVLTEEPGYPSLSPEPNLVTLLISGSVVENGMDPLDA